MTISLSNTLLILTIIKHDVGNGRAVFALVLRCYDKAKRMGKQTSNLFHDVFNLKMATTPSEEASEALGHLGKVIATMEKSTMVPSESLPVWSPFDVL